jgi:ADP-heptose:LPS heptosyltransferase
VKILLVRLRLVGDVVFTTPAIRALRRALPAAQLHYLVEEPAAAIVAGNPNLDRVIVGPRRSGVRRLADDLDLARALRRERYDVVIDFHGGPRASTLAWTTGSATRIGYAGTGRGWMYTHLVPRSRELRPRHSVENQWDLLEPLGTGIADRPDPARDPVEMSVEPVAAARVAARLAALGITPAHELIVAHVSAGNPFRRWPERTFADLVAGLARTSASRRIVLSSGPSDHDAAARIRALALTHADVRASGVPDAGEFTLGELRALLDRAALFIGGDSGPLHVAATTAVPIVGISGPTLPARSAPWRDPRLVTESLEVGPLACRPCAQVTCAPGDFRCLTTIPAAVALAACERALAGRRAIA